MSHAGFSRRFGAGVFVAVFSIVLSACGSSGSSGAGAGAGASGATSAGSSNAFDAELAASSSPDSSYKGVDAPYFTTLPEPATKSGIKFKVGYLSEFNGQPILLAMQQGAQNEVQKLGGTFVAKDAGLDPQKQASQLNELISQKVDVIIGDPIVSAALAPGIAAAKQAGIPFIEIDGPADETQPLVANAVTAVTHSFDYIVWKTMKGLAAEHPGATFATMGLALPVDPLIYLCKRVQYWGTQFGLKFLGQVDATNDTPAGYGPALNTILTKYPDVKIVVTYNDQSVVAAATTVATNGRNVFVATPNGGQALSQQALNAGKVDMVYRVPWEGTGTQAAIAAYDVVSKQHLPLPKFVNLTGPVLTKATANKAQWIQ